jgi:uncharacterized membrane protein
VIAPSPDWLPQQQPLTWLLAFAINGLLIGLAQRLPLLTKAGWCHAAILGTILWGSLGVRGWLAVVAYLLMGSLVTRLGFRRKQQQGLAEGRGGRRGPENVWGSAATGALLAMATALAPSPWHPPLLLAFVASFAAKLADTCGSEVLGLLPNLAATVLVSVVGLLATLLESVIGATAQRRFTWLSNELVNGIQTALAAALALLGSGWLLAS